MKNNRPTERTFCAGDHVVLAEGSYEGTPGVFLHLKTDHNWADITEWNGRVRSHPVAWLTHAPTGSPASE